jgi:hypothetical protein
LDLLRPLQGQHRNARLPVVRLVPGDAMTQNLEAIRRFILGGIAIFTLVSKKSGDRRTFRVRKAEDVDGSGRPHGFYVDLLTGPNNTEDYRYLAYMWIDQRNGLGVKVNKKGFGAEAFQVFEWLVKRINAACVFGRFDAQVSFQAQAEFFHAGRCSVCGRTLTDPTSIELGIGPICAGRAA